MGTTVIEQTAETSKERLDLRQIGRDGLRGLFKVQSALLDFAAEQNAIAFQIVRERVDADPSSPATTLIDSVEDIFENVVSAQRSLVDMGMRRVERGPVVKDEQPKSKRERRPLPRIPLRELFRNNFEATVQAQREILSLIEKQGKLGVETADQFARSRTGRSLRNLARKAKESIDNLIATQENLVEIAARQGKDSIALMSNQEERAISGDLAKHAEEGVDNLRRTQEKILKIASDLNERAYGDIREETEDTVITLSRFAERLEEGIERAIRAQNEILDASVRAVNRTKKKAEAAKG